MVKQSAWTQNGGRALPLLLLTMATHTLAPICRSSRPWSATALCTRSMDQTLWKVATKHLVQHGPAVLQATLVVWKMERQTAKSCHLVRSWRSFWPTHIPSSQGIPAGSSSGSCTFSRYVSSCATNAWLYCTSVLLSMRSVQFMSIAAMCQGEMNCTLYMNPSHLLMNSWRAEVV